MHGLSIKILVLVLNYLFRGKLYSFQFFYLSIGWVFRPTSGKSRLRKWHRFLHVDDRFIGWTHPISLIYYRLASLYCDVFKRRISMSYCVSAQVLKVARYLWYIDDMGRNLIDARSTPQAAFINSECATAPQAAI